MIAAICSPSCAGNAKQLLLGKYWKACVETKAKRNCFIWEKFGECPSRQHFGPLLSASAQWYFDKYLLLNDFRKSNQTKKKMCTFGMGSLFLGLHALPSSSSPSTRHAFESFDWVFSLSFFFQLQFYSFSIFISVCLSKREKKVYKQKISILESNT